MSEPTPRDDKLSQAADGPKGSDEAAATPAATDDAAATSKPDATLAAGRAARRDDPEAGSTLAGRTHPLERAAKQDAAAAGDDSAEAPTERREPVDATSPQTERPETPAGRDVARTLGAYVRGRAALLADLARRHRAACVALALVAACAVALFAVALVQAGSPPSTDQVQADARAAFPAPERPAGTFDETGALVTQGVEVRSVTRSQSAPEGTDARFGASGYAVADVTITYAGQGVRAVRGATLGYALVDGTWSLMAGARDDGVSWSATAGVSQRRVSAGSAAILERAERESGQEGLAELYADAAVQVTSEEFSEKDQTDVVELAWEVPGTFVSYACRARVTFWFAQASGQWEIRDVETSDGATLPSLEPLVGTWTGAFQRQETDGTKCLGAREAGLTVTIEGATAGADGARLTGTVSGLAHYHDHPSADSNACEGDQALEAVPFSASAVDGADGLTFEATLPEDVGGTVRLTLSFGDEDAPERVTARVETSYPTTGTIFFIPYDETLVYTDAFTLARAS